MAIKRKPKATEEKSFPQEFDTAVRKAFQLQQISEIYKEAFDGEKKEIIAYLEDNDDGVEISTGPGGSIKHTCGTIMYQVRETPVFDNDVLAELVQSGEVNLLTLLEICKPKASDLKKVLGTKRYEEVLVEVKESEYLVMKANSSFKEEVRETFDLGGKTTVSFEEEEAAKPKAAPKKATPKKASAKFSKTDLDDADDEIASILESVKSVKKAKSKGA